MKKLLLATIFCASNLLNALTVTIDNRTGDLIKVTYSTAPSGAALACSVKPRSTDTLSPSNGVFYICETLNNPQNQAVGNYEKGYYGGTTKDYTLVVTRGNNNDPNDNKYVIIEKAPEKK